MEKLLDLSNLQLKNAPELILTKLNHLFFLSDYIESATNYQEKLIFLLKISIFFSIILLVIVFVWKILSEKKLKFLICLSVGFFIGSILGFNGQIKTIDVNKKEAQQLYEEEFVEFGNIYYDWSGINIFLN